MSVAIRPAVTEDSAAIAELVAGLGHLITRNDVRVNLDQLAREGLPQLVAEKDGMVIGLVGLDRMTPVYRPKPVARLTILIVADDFRGKGIGRALLDRAIEVAREWGCGMIEVTSNERLADAHAYYRQMGFEQTSRRFALRLD